MPGDSVSYAAPLRPASALRPELVNVEPAAPDFKYFAMQHLRARYEICSPYAGLPMAVVHATFPKRCLEVYKQAMDGSVTGSGLIDTSFGIDCGIAGFDFRGIIDTSSGVNYSNASLDSASIIDTSFGGNYNSNASFDSSNISDDSFRISSIRDGSVDEQQ